MRNNGIKQVQIIIGEWTVYSLYFCSYHSNRLAFENTIVVNEVLSRKTVTSC